MKYGYARVSTADQNPALQIAALRKAGIREQNIFIDHGISGASMRRPALLRCMAALKKGDTLTVWKLDRLGRSVRDVLNTLHDITSEGIHFKSLTEAIDTKTPIGRAMLHMAALLAELERGLIIERTRAGLAAAKRRGVKLGRKGKLSPAQVAHAKKLLAADESPSVVAGLFGVSRQTIWRQTKPA